MPTPTDVTNLKINRLTEAQYDAAVQSGAITANELSFLTDVKYAEDTIISTISTATVTQALANNYIYNCTVDMTSIEITLPATPTANFCAQLNFTSGSTPTAFTSPVGMVWLGDDVSTTFVPVANKRYSIMVFFDGVSTRGIVQAA